MKNKLEFWVNVLGILNPIKFKISRQLTMLFKIIQIDENLRLNFLKYTQSIKKKKI